MPPLYTNNLLPIYPPTYLPPITPLQLLSAGHSDPALASELKLQNAELFDITNPQGKGVVRVSVSVSVCM